MSSSLTKDIFLQPFIINTSASSSAEVAFEASGKTFQTKQLGPSQSSIVAQAPQQLTKSFMTSLFSSIPVLRGEELKNEYRELGEALGQMTELEEGDEWKIEPRVFQAASYVAAQLRDHGIPSPHLFSHGKKSVVFNWTKDDNTLYLTVSADRVSALISTPERIKRRLEVDYSKLPEAMRMLMASYDYRLVFVIVSGVPQSQTQPEIVSESKRLLE